MSVTNGYVEIDVPEQVETAKDELEDRGYEVENGVITVDRVGPVNNFPSSLQEVGADTAQEIEEAMGVGMFLNPPERGQEDRPLQVIYHIREGYFSVDDHASDGSEKVTREEASVERALYELDFEVD